MRESVPTNEPEAYKRRSTRIVQAVPLTITGVDALGRPFQERTSTLIINCHGCRFQSKHYVLKNMWVTLEVPHEEAGHPPRTVRARVMWIQRPRSVRELFQVGVELEVNGNFWGIAFPPSDWFPFPEGLAAVSSPAASTAPEPQTQTPWPSPFPAGAAEDNVRTIPLAPSVEPALPIEPSADPQFVRLLEEAKQDVLATVRMSAAEAVSLEARPLVASLELQLKNAAEKSIEAAAATAAEQAFQRVKRSQVDAFLKECNRSLEESAKRAIQQLTSQFAELEQERNAAFEKGLQKRIQESLAKASEQAIRAACERVKEVANTVSREIQESGRAAREKWISEIEAKGTDTTYAFESLFKSAEWYEKKVYTQIQSAIDKGVQDALATLKEKAREMSGVFGAELDRYSRSYVAHTQGQVEEAARENLERLEKHAEEMAALAESIEGLNNEAIEEYKRKLEAASNSWLLTTVSRLSQQTDQHVQMLTKAAEERVRAACTEVFSGVGDALRRGLTEVDPATLLPRKPGG